MVRDPAIQKVMSQPIPDPGMTGTELVKAAYEGGGEDNVSVIVVRITEETERTGQVGIQFLSKPETVTLPELPAQ
jgi:serine/threonine protein phosphatase PrpC